MQDPLFNPEDLRNPQKRFVCPACSTGRGRPKQVITGQKLVVIQLRCEACGHSWIVQRPSTDVSIREFLSAWRPWRPRAAPCLLRPSLRTRRVAAVDGRRASQDKVRFRHGSNSTDFCQHSPKRFAGAVARNDRNGNDRKDLRCA